MKKYAIVFLSLFCISSVEVGAQSIDEIINQHIEANGGMEKLSQLKSIHYMGNIATEEGEVGIELSIADKKGVRMEMIIEQVKNVQFANTQAGYNFLPSFGMEELQEMAPEALAAFQTQMDLESPLVKYAEKGHSIENEGIVELGSGLAYKLVLTEESGNKTYFFIDKTSGHIIKRIQIFNIGTEEISIENSFSDFRKNDSGFIFPYTTTSELGTVTFSKIETNIPLNDRLFEK